MKFFWIRRDSVFFSSLNPDAADAIDVVAKLRDKLGGINSSIVPELTNRDGWIALNLGAQSVRLLNSATCLGNFLIGGTLVKKEPRTAEENRRLSLLESDLATAQQALQQLYQDNNTLKKTEK
jgi:hypothetical protein